MSHGTRQLLGHHRWILAPEIIVAEAEIQRDQAVFRNDVGAREQKCWVARHLDIQPDLSEQFSTSGTDTVWNSESIGAQRFSSSLSERFLCRTNAGSSTPTPIAELPLLPVSAKPRLTKRLK